MSITNAVLQNWPLNGDNLLIKTYFSILYLCNFMQPKTSDNDFPKKKDLYINHAYYTLYIVAHIYIWDKFTDT